MVAADEYVLNSGLKELRLSAPGKVILLGEHSVVYGRKAIAAALQIRVRLRVRLNGGISKHITLRAPESGADAKVPIESIGDPLTASSVQVVQLVLTIINAFTLDLAVLDGSLWELRSDIPLSAGLGSSAAVSVVTTAACLLLSQETVSSGPFNRDQLNLINEKALIGEKLVHGPTASGLDNTIVTFGGVMSYAKSQPPSHLTPVEEFQNLKWVVWNSGIVKNTRLQVERVRRLYDSAPNVVERVLDTMGTIVETFESQILGESTWDVDQIATLFSITQGLLRTLGVSHPKIDAVIGNRLPSGTKITGSGGGGCTLSIIRGGDVWDSSLDAREVSLGGAGVTLDAVERE